jgi:hypothetical protein
MNADYPSGKNIVLCSDGTGNTGGKGRGTNVWRLFQAVDLSHGAQVAFHDDGVGTQDFKLLKAIGGATGAGLGRNIRQLYASLVRVYDDGDRVYIFGFSRGAYTVRSLANFIDRFGILDRHAFDTPNELEREIFRLYDDYRREKRRDKASHEGKTDPRFCPDREGVIAFLGVWDTVDAIGVPFDELREWFRQYMPWKHHAYELNPSIKAAFHALAIDDERKTFHPNMFDERNRSEDAGPVEQVWFAGVHSNVGGGYPKDQVAYNSLDWMMRKAADPSLYQGYVPLRFHEGVLKEYKDVANPHGKLYDSRSGLTAYYRFSPRDIGGLCKDAGAGAAKIHTSAMVRIARRTGGYAPFNIPEDYEVVDVETEPTSPLSKAGSHDLEKNKEFMQRAKGFTSWRKCLYAAFLIVTGLLVVVVAWQMLFYRDAEIAGWLPVIAGAAKSFIPDILAGAVDAAFMRVGWLVIFAGLFGLLFWARGFLKQLVRDLAGMGWRAAYLEANLGDSSSNDDAAKKEKRRQQLDKLKELRARVGRSAGAAIVWAAGRIGLTQWIWCVVWFALIPIGVYLVGWYHPASDWADACSVSKQAALGLDRAWHITQFETSNPCYRTGIPLQRGRDYRIKVSAENWFDSTIPAGPGGFENEQDADGWFMKFWEPYLRAKGPGYFVLMGQVIGEEKSSDDSNTTRPVSRSESFVIGNAAELIKAPATGELILFVNDVRCPLCPPGTYGFYANNKGTATISVKEIGQDDNQGRSQHGRQQIG